MAQQQKPQHAIWLITAAAALILALPAGARDNRATNMNSSPELEVTMNQASDNAKTTDWRTKMKKLARNSLVDLEDYADVVWTGFARRLGINEPRYIANYTGYGNEEYIWVTGRLLANKPYGGPKDDDNWFDNLRATYGRWNSREIAHAPITLSYNGQVQQVETDGEGYYHGQFRRQNASGARDRVLAEYRTDDDHDPISALHTVYFATPNSKMIIVSDMDDTVIHTGLIDMLVAAQLTFLNNAKTRKPLAGVGSLYRELQRGASGNENNPIFYVSNSAWNMYDLLRDFVDLNNIPGGPILLRDIGFHKEGEGSSDHKINTIRQILDRYTLPVLLVGDSGQHDTDIYREIAQEYPDRIHAIYIRDVDPDADSAHDARVDGIMNDFSGDGVPFLRVADSTLIAEHARKLGLLSEAQVAEVETDTRTDKGRDTLTEEVVEEALTLNMGEQP